MDYNVTYKEWCLINPTIGFGGSIFKTDETNHGTLETYSKINIHGQTYYLQNLNIINKCLSLNTKENFKRYVGIFRKDKPKTNLSNVETSNMSNHRQGTFQSR